MVKKLCILGVTGSIGLNCLDVVKQLGGRFEVVALAANSNAGGLVKAARACGARRICLASCRAAESLPRKSLRDLELSCGPEAVAELARLPEVDIVVNAMVGASGLASSMAALEAGKRLALANKESLVMAGAHLMNLAVKVPGAQILPVDSEHSAIFQLIEGHRSGGGLERVVITASGGPFRGRDRQELEKATFEDSLRHPTWSMGPKITVDSASLANKGLEVIEAHYLFGLEYDKIDVLVHPQSIVHGMAVFHDGVVIAHLGVPDMRIPIQYALTYPERLANRIGQPDFSELARLTFEPVDEANFPCLALAYRAGRTGGVATSVYNAANEVAVELFSKGKICFTEIPGVIEKALERVPGVENPSLDQILEADRRARETAFEPYRLTREKGKPLTTVETG
ncbi:MAG TPA: 1-deoxy-D-xylulose-5-phosphate reductoisomerase [Candidatus Glassbacteria bacterium]|nr:1-deoxy-D-xylulose-5-phosphate reductoisomerase [Candidatus Glassbacteria bacterium]